MQLRHTLLFALLFSACIRQEVRSQNAVFDITYGGFTLEAEAAFQYAADIWSQYLISDVPIKVSAKMVFLLPGQLGITFPNGEKNFPGAPYADVWYASCLANALAGEELNPGEMDIDVFLNTGANWYFGTDGAPAGDEYDFVSTVLHELCHGLGFLSLANKIGMEGSFGMIYAESFSPLVTSFPWPQLDTLPGAFDIWLRNGDDVSLLDIENPSDALGLEVTGNNIFLESPEVMAAAGEAGRIYAPSTFTLGSSLSHWNEGTYPVGDVNEFMTPFATDGHANHVPGPLTLAVLKEIGWEIDTTTTVEEHRPADITIYPNPADDFIHIAGTLPGESFVVTFYNMFGEAILTAQNTTDIDISDLPPGVFVVTLCTTTYSASLLPIAIGICVQ